MTLQAWLAKRVGRPIAFQATHDSRAPGWRKAKLVKVGRKSMIIEGPFFGQEAIELEAPYARLDGMLTIDGEKFEIRRSR